MDDLVQKYTALLNDQVKPIDTITLIHEVSVFNALMSKHSETLNFTPHIIFISITYGSYNKRTKAN